MHPKKTDREEAFDTFWAAYPRKIGKQAAKKAFAKVPKSAWPKLVPAIDAQKKSRQWTVEDGRFIPNPATWLNQGRWDDEAPAAGMSSRPNQVTASGDYGTRNVAALLDKMEGLV